MKQIAPKVWTLVWPALLLLILVWMVTRTGNIPSEDTKVSSLASVSQSHLDSSAARQDRPLSDEGAPAKNDESAEKSAIALNVPATLQSALEQAAQLSNPDNRRDNLANICYQWAEKDPAGAVAAAQYFHLSDGSGTIMENLTQQWAAKDLPEAMAWASAHASGTERDQLIGRVAFIEAQTQPAEAAALVVEQIPEGEIQMEAAMSVVHQWGLQDMTAAAAWVERFPEGDLRTRAVNELQGIANHQQAMAEPEK